LRWADLYNANLSGANFCRANLYETNGIEQLIFAKALGSRKDETQWDFVNDILICGCFKGTLAEFASRVETTHENNPVRLAEYRAMIRYFKEVRDARQRAEAVPMALSKEADHD
jgi:hypothetical protein